VRRAAADPIAGVRAAPLHVASTTGAGEQALSWEVGDGEWRAAVLSADGSRAVSAELTVGAELPALLGVSLGLLGGGVVLLTLGGVVLVAAVKGRGRRDSAA
jgi:hypothetical protein